ncbi:unannotated protein [freshwater metagenome]|uniref:Unannotated protein n=1 Tax=freshwater metagenome TaxID=449393 RepID=A0A6J6JCD2_9ZZZZ
MANAPTGIGYFGDEVPQTHDLGLKRSPVLQRCDGAPQQVKRATIFVNRLDTGLGGVAMSSGICQNIFFDLQARLFGGIADASTENLFNLESQEIDFASANPGVSTERS